jgi:hypothetical protein
MWTANTAHPSHGPKRRAVIFTRRSHYPPGKEPTAEGAGYAPGPVWTIWKGENLLPLSRTERNLDRSARSLVPTPTTLTRFNDTNTQFLHQGKHTTSLL